MAAIDDLNNVVATLVQAVAQLTAAIQSKPNNDAAIETAVGQLNTAVTDIQTAITSITA